MNVQFLCSSCFEESEFPLVHGKIYSCGSCGAAYAVCARVELLDMKQRLEDFLDQVLDELDPEDVIWDEQAFFEFVPVSGLRSYGRAQAWFVGKLARIGLLKDESFIERWGREMVLVFGWTCDI